MEDKDLLIEWAKRLQSLAQAGLTYGTDNFDLERYQEIRDISAEIMAYKSDLPIQKVKDLFYRSFLCCAADPCGSLQQRVRRGFGDRQPDACGDAV